VTSANPCPYTSLSSALRSGGATLFLAVVTVMVTPAVPSAVEETRRVREDQSRALVTLELWPWGPKHVAVRHRDQESRCRLCQGHTHRFEPNFVWPAGGIGGTGTINEIEFFRDLPFLGPHDEILLFAGTRDWLNGPDVPTIWSGTIYFIDDTGPQSLSFRLNLTNLLQMASKLPYGDPSWAPPIRRGWAVFKTLNAGPGLRSEFAGRTGV